MTICDRSWVSIAGPAVLIGALCACGNDGAPPYAPEARRAASAPAPGSVSPAAPAAPPAPRLGTPASPAPAPAPGSASAPTPAAPPRAVTAASPSDPRVSYELREKCGEDARRWYRYFHEDGGVDEKKAPVSHEFISHYDARTNDCFALTRSITSRGEVQSLTNVLENRSLGTLSYRANSPGPAQCHVAGQTCTSRQEWESLTSTYMND